MTSEQQRTLLNTFNERNLIFQPDFLNVDPSKHYRYCSIDGIPDQKTADRSIGKSRKESILWQKWWPTDGNGHPNKYYLENKSKLEEYLKEYKNGGYKLLKNLLMDVMNNKIEELDGLKKFFDSSHYSESQILEMFANIIRIALKCEDVLPEKIHRCVDGVYSATFSQEQCAVLLAWMFFVPSRNQSFLNFLGSSHPICVEKLKFLLNYFQQITEEMPCGVISFLRVKNESLMAENEWNKKRDNQLVDVSIFDDLCIEQTALCTQIDFANKHIGGGVLRLGAVQEEIRFLMCPELIVSMLLFDKQEPDEAISIVGAQVYSSYSGYVLIQVIAASLANRPLYICTFGELELGKTCQQILKRLQSDNVTIGELYSLLLKIQKSWVPSESNIFISLEEMLDKRRRSTKK